MPQRHHQCAGEELPQGRRCENASAENSAFCGVHQGQDQSGPSQAMASPTEGGRADDATPVAVQLDKVKARIDEFRGDLINTIDALREVLNSEQRLTELRSTPTRDLPRRPENDAGRQESTPPVADPTTAAPSTAVPTMAAPTTAARTSAAPTTAAPATAAPTATTMPQCRENDAGHTGSTPDEHYWPRYTAQMKQEAMYVLRASIQGFHTVEAGYEAVREKLNPCPESLLDEALLARDQNRGMSLLSFAAQNGNKEWFLHLVGRIRQERGVSVLVKELRAWDINGAPLLFQAASSRTKHECFNTVCYTLRTILTRSGLIEQITAFDRRGRNLMMHAARGNHVAVFKQVEAIFHRFFPERENLLLRDHTGRTILHHAAEAGCSKILDEVMRSLSEEEFKELSLVDKNGRTPIMHVLRLRHGYVDDSDLEKQFSMLYERRGSSDWMHPRQVLHPEEVPEELRGIEVKATTELMHAARGGCKSLQLALEKIRQSTRAPVVSIGEALNVTFNGRSATGTAHEAWGWGMLLAAAARGGHVGVLNAVVFAIQTGNFAIQSPAEEKASEQEEQKERRNSRESGGTTQAEPNHTQSPAEEKTGAQEGHEGRKTSDLQESERNRLRDAVNAISKSGRSIYTLAVVSRKNEAVEWVANFVRRIFQDKKEVWEIVGGEHSQTSPITCAAAASIEDEGHGEGMFDTVFECLIQAADDVWGKGSDESKDKVTTQLSYRPRECGITPLAASAFRSNWFLFRKIYDLYETRTGSRWSRDEVRANFPDMYSEVLAGVEHTAMHEHTRHKFASFESQTTRLSAVMWREMLEAYERALTTDRSEGRTPLRSRREEFKSYSRTAVNLAIADRTFDNLRDLVREGFPLHDKYIRKLLLHIEDHEEDVIRIVMFAVGNASNPLVMAAGVSRDLKLAEQASPMHRVGLRRLQSIVDDLTNELLDKLPHTVRGMGTTLLKSVFRQSQYGPLDAAEQRRRDTLCNLAGYIAVEWILTPHLIINQTGLGDSYKGPSYLDPLSAALDRGSEALKFINSPLVLDYVHVKFSCSLPHWASAAPFKQTIHQGFYKYRHLSCAKYEHGDRRSCCFDCNSPGAFLLRFLQGWDHQDMNGESDDKSGSWGDQPAPSAMNGDLNDRNCPDQSALSKSQTYCNLDWSCFPHVTFLPGLQFSLAGILGKPQTFYEVPAVRFMFELFSYLVLVGLFCSSVILEDSYRIPYNEALFYVFVAGTLSRELLEFGDGIPGRMEPQGRRQRGKANNAETPTPEQSVDVSEASGRRAHSRTKSMDTGGGETADSSGGPRRVPHRNCTRKSPVKGMGRLAIAARRYIGHDTWNLLDAMTVTCVLVAFIARLLAMPRFGGPPDPGGAFFVAQVFLAVSAPLFFARLLLLPQIDGTLGPMTQIIWKMMSQTLRFSVFLVIFMASFALSFHALFHNCDNDSVLGESFGNFHQALVVAFGAPLGDFEFHRLFDEAADQCPDHASPEWVGDVGTLLLVIYLIVMAVILFNLLIAILTTAHWEVHKNGEHEFHVARTRLILQSSKAVARRRIVPPLNLVQIIPGILADTASEIYWWYKKGSKRRSNGEQLDSVYEPFTSSFLWYTMEGFMQRVLFALTMGVAALLLSALLWTVSLPLVAWNIVRWVGKAHQGEKKAPWTKTRWGYFRSLAFAVLSAVAWVAASVLGAVLVLACIVGSFFLWLRGLVGLVDWFQEEWRRREIKEDFPTPMPGQEEGVRGSPDQEESFFWREAWESVMKTRTYRRQNKHESAHFYIDPLLQSTTGLDLEQLGVAILQKEEKVRREKRTTGTNGEATCGHIFP